MQRFGVGGVLDIAAPLQGPPVGLLTDVAGLEAQLTIRPAEATKDEEAAVGGVLPEQPLEATHIVAVDAAGQLGRVLDGDAGERADAEVGRGETGVDGAVAM